MYDALLPVTFFFGADNKCGYRSLFGKLYDPFAEGTHYILKGGPGTGKSTIMKKFAEKFEKQGLFVERGICSADPESLDLVYVPEINFSVIDGTPPHVFDPSMPGVTEHIVDLTAAWNKEYLKSHADEITALTRDCKLQHKKSAEYLRLASQLTANLAAIGADFTDREKICRYAQRLAHRVIPERKSASYGRLNLRFLSAVTPDGIRVEHDTVASLCERMITVNDTLGAAAPFIVEYLADCALENGYDIYKCYCPVMPDTKPEHIIIPELKLAVFTENAYHHALDDETNAVRAGRFSDKTEAAKYKERIAFVQKTKKEMIDEAVRKMSLAKNSHDKLEEFYIKATDFNVINEITDKLLRMEY